MNLNNKVIKVLNPEHGKKVIDFFKNNGVDTRDLLGCSNLYYGVKNIFFNSYWFTDIGGCEIIELPEKENNYAKDIEEEKESIIELTPQDISEGKGVGISPHLIRIKK